MLLPIALAILCSFVHIFQIRQVLLCQLSNSAIPQDRSPNNSKTLNGKGSRSFRDRFGQFGVYKPKHLIDLMLLRAVLIVFAALSVVAKDDVRPLLVYCAFHAFVFPFHLRFFTCTSLSVWMSYFSFTLDYISLLAMSSQAHALARLSDHGKQTTILGHANAGNVCFSQMLEYVFNCGDQHLPVAKPM